MYKRWMRRINVGWNPTKMWLFSRSKKSLSWLSVRMQAHTPVELSRQIIQCQLPSRGVLATSSKRKKLNLKKFI